MPSAPNPSIEPLGVRALAKQRTAEAIVDAALPLFLACGYDAVTTEQIARAAGVTQRTLFRYFPRKELILYARRYDYVDRYEAFLNEAMSIWPRPYDAVRSAFQSLTGFYEANRASVSQVYAIIQGSDQLQAIERGHQMRIDELTAFALDGAEVYFARQGRPTLESRIVASVLFGTIRPMFREWLRGELPGELRLYAEIGWANVEPTILAAQAYAETAVAAFRRVPPR